MNSKHWWNYLMPRSVVLALSLGLWFAVLLILALTESVRGLFLIPVGIGVLLVHGMVWLFLILLPYMKMEKKGELFLSGYVPESEISSFDFRMSPFVEHLAVQVNELVSPARMYDNNKRKSQYIALQNQINPHFLYNTLDSIRSEAMLAQLESVADMTEALASFFRYTISKVENLVSVEEELQNCKTYFRIQQYRFEGRLQMEMECDPSEWDEIRRCRLPKLTMQPILENAIIHGTELKTGIGKVGMRFERTGKRLLIHVYDNGVGMDETMLNELNSRLGKNAIAVQREENRKGGFALVNVDHRIRILFGDEYGLHVSSILGYGTDVEISIPIITSDSEISMPEVLQ